MSLAHSQHLVISPNISHKLERLVGVDNEVVGVLVGGVGDGGSNSAQLSARDASSPSMGVPSV